MGKIVKAYDYLDGKADEYSWVKKVLVALVVVGVLALMVMGYNLLSA